MSVPRPARSAYLRRLHEKRLQYQVEMARDALRRRRGRIVVFVVAAVLFLAAAGGAGALAIERLFR